MLHLTKHLSKIECFRGLEVHEEVSQNEAKSYKSRGRSLLTGHLLKNVHYTRFVLSGVTRV